MYRIPELGICFVGIVPFAVHRLVRRAIGIENGMLDGLLSCPGFTQGVSKKGTVVRPEFEMSSEIRVFRDASFSFPPSLMRTGNHMQCSTTCLSP